MGGPAPMALLRRARRGDALHAGGRAAVRVAAFAEPADPGVRSGTGGGAARPVGPAVRVDGGGARGGGGGAGTAFALGPGARRDRGGGPGRRGAAADRVHALGAGSA